MPPQAPSDTLGPIVTVMSRNSVFCLVATLLFPVLAWAQQSSVDSLHDYLEELNSQCPIHHEGGWGVNSFTMVGDNYALVDVMLPANMSMFLSSFSSSEDKVKRLWIRQLHQYGEQWDRFVDTMVKANRRILLNLHPAQSDDTALIMLFPSDFEPK